MDVDTFRIGYPSPWELVEHLRVRVLRGWVAGKSMLDGCEGTCLEGNEL